MAKNIVETEIVIWSYVQNDIYNYRDEFMGGNTLWVSEWLNAKTAYWAHNFHVAERKNYGLGGSAGNHLRTALGTDYQVVGFSFSKGRFTAVGGSLRTHNITEDPLVGSMNFHFHHANEKQFIFNFHTIGEEWENWLNSNAKKMLTLGAVFDKAPIQYYLIIDFTVEYDVMIYFDTTENSILL